MEFSKSRKYSPLKLPPFLTWPTKREEKNIPKTLGRPWSVKIAFSKHTKSKQHVMIAYREKTASKIINHGIFIFDHLIIFSTEHWEQLKVRHSFHSALDILTN